jgi:hypothetical protein
MKQLIVTPIVLVKLNVTSRINETMKCHRRQLIDSISKQFMCSNFANLFAVQLQYIVIHDNTYCFTPVRIST